MRIAIDIDEVLSQLLPKVLEYFNGLHGTNYTSDKCSSYDWHKIVDIPKEQEMDLYNSFVEAGNLKFLATMPGAEEGIKKLKDKHELIIVTARAKTFKEETEYWLNKYFSSSFKDIIYLRESIFGPMVTSKFETCQRIKAEVFIEDNVDNLQHFKESNIKTLILDHPWNRSIEMSENFVRVHSWNHIVEQINRY